jgi:hypothetical protein
MHERDHRACVEKKIAKLEARRAMRTTPKPGRIYHFAWNGEFLGSRQAVAKFLPSSPIINGVRMRYEKGRLVPRVRA